MIKKNNNKILYVIPILYVIWIYFLFLLAKITNKYYILFYLVLYLIVLFFPFFKIKKENEKYLLNSALIIKYLLIPFYIFGVMVAFFSYVLFGVGIAKALCIIGYFIMLGGSSFLISYILLKAKYKEISTFLTIIGIIGSFLFVVDVVIVTILVIKNKEDKIYNKIENNT